MKLLCAAPGCQKIVDVPWWKVLINIFKTGGRYTNIDVYCPEHLEWVSFGRNNDGDPNTNQEFLYRQK